MKKKLWLAAVLAVVGVSASAQEDAYHRAYMEYNPMQVTCDVGGGSNGGGIAGYELNMHGLTWGYLYGMSVSDKLPLFVELGGQLSYAFDKYTDEYGRDDYSRTHHFLSMGLPVNFTYRLQSAGSDWAVSPFVGLVGRLNLLALENQTYEGHGGGYWDNGSYKQESTSNMMSRHQMGEFAWKRFSLGWSAGINIEYNHFVIGLRYGADITDLAYKTELKQWGLSLGAKF